MSAAGLPPTHYQSHHVRTSRELTVNEFWDVVRRVMIKVEIPSSPKKCFLWPGKSTEDGYGLITVKGKQVRIHRFLFEGFHGVRLTTSQILRHDCDTPACCNIAHLTIGTHQENMQDAARRGRRQGVRNNAAKLDERKVKKIRKLFDKGVKVSKIAECFEVSSSTINRILNGQAWAHV